MNETAAFNTASFYPNEREQNINDKNDKNEAQPKTLVSSSLNRTLVCYEVSRKKSNLSM